MDRSKTPVRKLSYGDKGATDEAPTEKSCELLTVPIRNIHRMNSLTTLLRSPKLFAGRTQRRCTDMCCLLIVTLFSLTLYSTYDLSQDGRVERLTHGFDYRGRLCGLDVNESYLLWCTPNGQDTINWADPICVEKCPSQDNLPTVMCPLPKIHKEVEIPGPNASISIVKTVSQDVVPSPTSATKALLSYCIADTLAGQEDIHILTQIFQGSGISEYVSQGRHHLVELVERWRLIVLAACFAVFFAYSYLVLLRAMARPLIYASFFLILGGSAACMCYSFQKSQPVLMNVARVAYDAMPVERLNDLVPGMNFDWRSEIDDVVPDVISDMADSMVDSGKPVLDKLKTQFKAKSEVLKGAVSKGFAKVPSFVTTPLLNEVRKFREFSLEGMIRPLAGSYTVHVLFMLGISSALLCYVLSMLLLHSRKTIKLAIACMEEACSVLFTVKSLMILPFLQCVAWCGITVSFLMMMLQVLSTVRVEARPLTIAGLEVQGIDRSFHPTMQHIIHMALWVFGLLWVQEMVHTMCHFAASYATVQWFFSPFDGLAKRAPYFLVPRGFLIGVFFHTGSLAFVAFVSAFIRLVRWMWYFGSKRKEQGRLMAFFTNSVDCCLRVCESFIHYMSSHILTEIALNGNQSFCASAASVGKILTANVSNAAMLHGTEWLFTIVGTLSISAATALSLVAAIHNPHVINIDCLQDLDGADVNLFAVVGACLGGTIGYAFMTLLDRVAETLMYCYFSYKEDSERMGNTPQSLARLVTLHDA